MKRSGIDARLLILVAAAVGILIGVIVVSGVNPSEALADFWQATFGTPTNIARTVRETTPLLIAGLAVFIALKAGLFNIGVEGQLTIGAMCCTLVALAIPGPAGIVLGLAAGMAGGALWALPAGLIKAYRGGHEVISTIMLNQIAAGLTLALLAGPIKAPGQQSTTTANLTDNTLIPNFIDQGRLEYNWVSVVAILLILGAAVVIAKTVFGYELRLTGDNPRAAEFAGVDVKKMLVRAMSISGAFGGLAGATLVLAYEHRFYDGISSGYGFDALGVALLAGGSPIGIIPSALLFGMLAKGSTALQLLGIPKGVTFMVLGLLVIVFAAIRYRRLARATA